MGTVATHDRADALKREALKTFAEARAKMDEWEGKDKPADVQADIKRLFDRGDYLTNEAELEHADYRAQKWEGAIDESKQLQTPEIKGNEAKEEAVYDRIFAKYGLKRWEIDGAIGTTKNFNRLFGQTRKAALLELQNQGKLTGSQEKALQGYGEGTATGFTGGGYITPDIYVAQFVNKLYLASHLRQAGARVVPLRSDITRYPKMSTASAAASLIAEVAAVTASQATIGEQAFTAYMFRALSQASIELVADAEFDILSEIILPDFGQQFAAAENSYFTTGTGTTQPSGIITDVAADSANTAVSTASTVFATNSTTLLLDTFIACMHKAKPQYRGLPSTGWMLHDSIISLARQIKATSAGTYLCEPSQQLGAPDTLYNKPVYYNQSMVAAGATASTYPILFGAFDYFWIGDRSGLDVKTAQELYLANAQIGYFAFKRVDSHVMQTEAFGIVKAT